MCRAGAIVACLLGCCLSAALHAAAEEPLEPSDREESPPPQLAVTATQPDLPILDAIEGLIDEDEQTRRRAVDRVTKATEADLPTLEQFADSADPEIRRQVGVVLKKLKRGEFSLIARFPDRTPAAQIKFMVRLYVKENQKQQEQQGRIMFVQGRGVSGKEVASIDCAADGEGKVTIGRFNDGDYLYLIEPQDPLPAQPIQGKVSMRSDSQPLEIVVKRGVTVTVTVTDSDGKPLPEVTVYNSESSDFLKQTRQMNPMQTRMMLGHAASTQTDEKGVAVLEKVGLTEINVVAAKDTYDCAFKEQVKAEDGGQVQVALTMVKTVPYKCKLALRDAKGGALPAKLRVLAVRQNEVPKVLGQQWNLNLSRKEVDEYIKKGAVDLGEAPQEGEVALEVLPDQYFVVGLSEDDKRLFYGSFNVAVKDATIQVNIRELPRTGR